MSVEYQQASSIAVVKGVATNSQLANVVKFYTGSVTYDDEPSSKYATVTINGKTQRVMLCIAVSGTVAYDDSPCLYSTVSGHRCLNITEPTATETPDDIPNAITTLTISGKNYPAIRCILINKTPTYDGVSSTCTFTDDNGKIHTAQLVNQVGSGSIEKIVKGVPPLTLDDAIADSLQYVKAFGGTAQRNLPAGYTQRNFIYMMDGSYLLTDLVPTYDCKIEMDFETTSLPAGNGVFFGTRTNTSDGSGVNLAFTATKNIIIDTFGHRKTSSNVFAANTRYKYTYANSTSTLTSGSTTVETDASGGTDVITVPLVINAMNNNGTVYGNISGIYLYSFKMWDNQGNLIADYVPCAQLHPLTVGFYDMVTGTFKTATAGTFAAGTEAVPTPDAPMDIVCNNGVLTLSPNLFNKDATPYLSGQFINNTTTVSGNIITTVSGNYNVYRIPVSPSTNYTFGVIKAANPCWAVLDENDVVLQVGQHGSATVNSITVTTDATAKYLCLSVAVSGAYKCDDILQLVKGSVLPTYHPYGEIYTDGTVETINVLGKNLFNWHIGLKSLNDTTTVWQIVYGGVTMELNQSTGQFTVTGLSSGAGGRNSLRTQTFSLPAGTYTISATNNPAINIILVEETGGNTIAQTRDTTTFTLTETTPLHFGLGREQGTTYDDSFYLQIEQGSPATEYVPYNNSTATCEDLLSVGTYTDEQEIISGAVTRKVGVKVLDGTENWISGGGGTGVWANFQSITGVAFATADAFCSHSVYGGANVNIVNMNQNEFCLYDNGNISFKNANTTSTSDWATFLADQYAAGTPVIIVYPLAEPTTDTVTGQPMNTVAGDNTLEITQASLEDLEVEVKYEQ